MCKNITRIPPCDFRYLVCVALLTNVAARQASTAGESLSEIPASPYHLTAQPWRELDVPNSAYLERIEGICRFTARHQDERGAVIDPFLRREHQYSTPYFAYAVGMLLEAGQGEELKQAGIRSMDHATQSFAGGARQIPDQHGEFFIAPLTEALELYAEHVEPAVYERWRRRLKTPLEEVLRDLDGRTNNWRTYATKGQWLRARQSLVDHLEACRFIEDAWLHRTQRERIALDKWNLYQDWSSDPQSHAVEAVGRGNLLALVADGYDGPSRDEIEECVERGTRASLLWQGPGGQCPPNGRTDDHVFNDVLYQLAFEVMAERAYSTGDRRLAGQYRRAAALSFRSIERWCRSDEPWRGSFYVTKNHFDPAKRVGYQPASNYTNYNGTCMYHLAEALCARRTEIPQQPAPSEIGGYVIEADPRFGSVVANAGGMQLVANLRGDTVPKYGIYWTPLGVVRFNRAGWDGRLGPSDGARDRESGEAVSFAPTWIERGRWVRLAERADDYRGTPSVEFVHPLLVRMTILWHTVTGRGGPTFTQAFTLTPDGILTTLTCSDKRPFGLTLPMLTNDGRPLKVDTAPRIARVAYGNSGDEQCFLVVTGATELAEGKEVLSTYGWLRPMRVTAEDDTLRVFVFPHNPDEPDPEDVLNSFQVTNGGFQSSLGRVEGTVYVGRTSAGGLGRQMDLDMNGTDDVQFDQLCGFLLQLDRGQVTAVEADRVVTGVISGKKTALQPFEPVRWPRTP